MTKKQTKGTVPNERRNSLFSAKHAVQWIQTIATKLYWFLRTQVPQNADPQSADARPAKCGPAICRNAQLILGNFDVAHGSYIDFFWHAVATVVSRADYSYSTVLEMNTRGCCLRIRDSRKPSICGSVSPVCGPAKCGIALPQLAGPQFVGAENCPSRLA